MDPRTARRWHLLTGVVASAALLLQLALVVSGSAVLVEEDPPGLLTRLGRFVCYFTVQSNALVAVVSLLLATDPRRDGPALRVARVASVVGITITAVVHFLLLRPLLSLDGLDRWADVLLHQAVPVLALATWLWCGPRPRLDWRSIGFSLVWPVSWLAFILLVRLATGWVPYPFLDPADQGWAGVVVACLAVSALFLAVAAGARTVDRRLAARP
ncbi:Pr6Pr family membrane protein [Nocardioides coralli]|uniref:Pr6Pr family membrane protein n=1 Tax=Nocardioides coralli TaxID=2872154 RepID=UPI001CA3D17E|nr:Pr6Pr family membrane protein [Nocardioides coralli]QZY29094.1 Pr6Pr family membrane protein [Nocardioides coralli]